MRILLLVNYFPPEIGSGPHLPFELGETLVQRGHQVTVVTGFPRYNVPVLPERYRGRVFYREEMGGVTVLRMRAPIPYGKSKIARGLFHMLSPPVLTLRALPIARPDVVYTITPPLTSGIAARTVARRHRVPCVVNVQDLFPQNAVDLGLLHNRMFIRAFQAMERFVYRIADRITVMSDGNGDYVVAKGARREKVQTIANWVDTDLIRPSERLNDFRRANGIGKEFVVLFAGTMGWSQGLETVVECARELARQPEILFLLVGDGVERPRLERQAAGLSNVRFVPMQPKEMYPHVLGAADACLVTLRAEVSTPTVPSKMATIMAAGRPVLASLPTADASKLVNEARAGLVVPPGNARALAGAVLQLLQDPDGAQKMGRSGRVYAEEHLSREACVGQLEDLFRLVTHGIR